MNDGWH
ncbi:hypothetical protein G210_2951 [Candida maltosa Xu316]|nr:hypothetical protein G210_2951 [Candida maltosa Xu316]